MSLPDKELDDPCRECELCCYPIPPWAHLCESCSDDLKDLYGDMKIQDRFEK